jgi:hypothetical protein
MIRIILGICRKTEMACIFKGEGNVMFQRENSCFSIRVLC